MRENEAVHKNDRVVELEGLVASDKIHHKEERKDIVVEMFDLIEELEDWYDAGE